MIRELLNPAHKTLRAAAKAAQVSERTLRYWMRHDEEFTQSLRAAHAELRDQVLAELNVLNKRAVDNFRELLESEDEGVRMRASERIIDFNLKYGEKFPFDAKERAGRSLEEMLNEVLERLGAK